jgi:hypothetical protein
MLYECVQKQPYVVPRKWAYGLPWPAGCQLWLAGYIKDVRIQESTLAVNRAKNLGHFRYSSCFQGVAVRADLSHDNPDR